MMKRRYLGILAVLAVLSGCSPHFHLDFLGKDRLEEVVLLDSRAREKILLVDVSGVIGTTLRPGLFEREGDILSRVYYRLKKAEEDPRIKGVILRLDTPGGEVTASDILYHEISRFKTRTGIPVVGLMMGLAASGGYYVAAACDAIIAHPSTLTGSIGVISLFPNLKELLVKVGVDVQVIKS
ncbi:MAG: S49 family peptidase, partial [Candidatus Aminicenantales bacterium]